MALQDNSDLIDRFGNVVEELRAEGIEEVRIINVMFAGALAYLCDVQPKEERLIQFVSMMDFMRKFGRKL